MHPKVSAAGSGIWTLTFLTVLFTGCGSSSHMAPVSPGNPTSPSNPGSSSATFSVSGIVPASGAAQVALNTTVQITFSSAANATTVNTTNIKITNPNPVSGAVSYNSTSNTAVFTPAAPLAASSTYTVTVSGVSGTNGASLASPFKSTFTTVAAPSGGGGGGGATLQYQSPLMLSNYAVVGQVTIDTKGNTTVTLKGAKASTKLFVQFCPAIQPGAPNATTPCVPIFNTMTTDANGDATQSTMFPESGDWAGDFYVQDEASSSAILYQTWIAPGVNGETYQSTLVPETKANGGADTTQTKQDPLTSGAIGYTSASGMATFNLTGGLASTNYETAETETVYMDGSGSYELNTFNTDAKGDATSSTQLDGIGGDIFTVGPQSGQYAGYIGGFSIPYP